MEDKIRECVANGELLLISKDNMQALIKQAVREGIKAYQQEEKRTVQLKIDKRLRNTVLLLKNYRMLKLHAQEAVYTEADEEENATAILENMMQHHETDMIVESISRSARRTAIIVKHIETMLELYKAYCEMSDNREIEMRRYDIIKSRYIDEKPLTIKELSDKHYVVRKTVYADLKNAQEKLTALLFGVDGLK